jgi:hypothetical protein
MSTLANRRESCATALVAIRHFGGNSTLAGVNSSKYIVVINKDPEAPFFKAARLWYCWRCFRNNS